MLLLACALLLNNLHRRYPVFWFAPMPLPGPGPKSAAVTAGAPDPESTENESSDETLAKESV